MSPSQCRMAVAGLGWSWDDLVNESGISRDTIARFMRNEELRPSTVAALQTALEKGGVEFTNGDEPGVKLVKRKGKEARRR
jgi:hypothetical protein